MKRSPRMQAAHEAIRRVLAGSKIAQPSDDLAAFDPSIIPVPPAISWADADDLAERVLVALLPHFYCGQECPELESHGERRTGGLTDAR